MYNIATITYGKQVFDVEHKSSQQMYKLELIYKSSSKLTDVTVTAVSLESFRTRLHMIGNFNTLTSRLNVNTFIVS